MMNDGDNDCCDIYVSDIVFFFSNKRYCTKQRTSFKLEMHMIARRVCRILRWDKANLVLVYQYIHLPSRLHLPLHKLVSPPSQTNNI